MSGIEQQMKKTILLGAIIVSCATTGARSAELSITQRVVASEMNQIVFIKAITQRIAEQSPNYSIDDKKLDARRDSVMSIAKTMFSSGQAFMEAAGMNAKDKMSAELKLFFQTRGVNWSSSSAAYCELAEGLDVIKSPVSDYLVKR
ncbi:hypothetical protein [Ochrobactrum sp. BTU1]|uniref:hypothetical protein n=1 Tax=Ochrobactrum sp. BTU1 TaxID=2840456 RepID=UPI001C042ACA|nr:hypothetical protein KMS41_25455 [Ochrobactrum sp. BTU1]